MRSGFPSSLTRQLALAAVPALAVQLLLHEARHRSLACWALVGAALLAAAAPAAWPGSSRAGARERLEGFSRALALAGIGLWGLALAERLADFGARAAVCQILSPWMDEIMEGREAAKSWLVSRNTGIYTDLKDYPLLITFYGPVYYLVSGWTAHLTGSGMQAARLVSAASGLMLASVVGAFAARRSGSLLAGAVSGLVALCSPTMIYAAYARPDILALLLLMAGVLLLFAAMERERPPWPLLVPAAILLCLAAFTKQQTWAYIGAATLYYLWRKLTRPAAARFALLLAACGAAGLAAAQFATDGEYLRQSALYPRKLPGLSSYNSTASALSRIGEFLAMHWGLAAVYALALWTRRPRRVELTDALFALGFVSLMTILRWWGSSVNHFIPLILIMLVEIAALLARLGREKRYAILALALAVMAAPRFGVSPPAGPDPCGQAAEREGFQRASEKLGTIAGPVIMDIEGAYAFQGGPHEARLKLYDAFDTDFYDQTGMWRLLDSRLAGDIRARRAAAFVDTRVFKSGKLTDLVDRHYRLDQTIGRYSFYLPREEMAILAWPMPGGQAGEDGPARLSLAARRGLKDWGGYAQPLDGETGLLEFELSSLRPMGAVALALQPRFTAPGQRITVSWSPDGGGYRELAAWEYEGPPPGTGFENRREVQADVNGVLAFFRVELTGAAQLWMTEAKPVTARVSAGR
jgi:hypothetical protein